MSEFLVPGSKLGQLLGGVVTQTVYSASYYTEIHRVVVANLENTAHSFTLFHTSLTAGAGTALYTTPAALYYNQSIAAKTTFVLDSPHIGAGISMAPGDRIGFDTDNTSGATVTLYGTTRAAR